MERPNTVLAHIETFGKVYRCVDCDNIHLQVGPMNVSFSVEAYMQLVTLVNASAAAFELSVARWEDERS